MIESESISLPPRPTLEQYADAFAHLAIVQAVGLPVPRLAVEAAGMVFVQPLELCLLRLLLERAATVAKRVVFVAPTDRDVANYIVRMNLSAGLSPNVEATGLRALGRRRNLADRLIELTPISTRAEVAELDSRVSDVASQRFVDRSVAKAFVTAFLATTDNAIEHAESPSGAFVAAQRYRDRLELAVVDGGRGIAASLAENPMHVGLDDESAIVAALGGATRHVGPGHGAGLAELVEKVSRVRASTLLIASGRGTATVTAISGRSDTRVTSTSVATTGTWIGITLHEGQ